MKTWSALRVQHSSIFAMLSLTVVLGLTACERKPPAVDDTPSPASEVQAEQARLAAKVEKIQLNMPECKGQSCPQVDIQRLESNYPQLDQAIDQYILNYAKVLVKGFEIEPATADVADQTAALHKTSESRIVEMTEQMPSNKEGVEPINPHAELQSYINKFVQLADEVKSLGSAAQLSLYIKPQVLQAKGQVATVVVNASDYMGGAHGSSAQQYFNFDLENETLLNLDAVIVEGKRKAFNDLAYTAFEQWIAENQPDIDAEQYQKLWTFSLSENFYLSKNGLILQYGEYEIGPYAVGLPRLVIPYSELQDILKEKYLPEQPTSAASQPMVTTKQ